MEPDEVFVRKVQDLQDHVSVESLTGIDSQYEVLMAGALLRELLVGDPPLMDTVNRSCHLRLRFDVSRVTAYEQVVLADGPMFFARGDGLHPGAGFPGATVASLNRDQFLREMVMVIGGETITVRDIIDYVANAAGAVHFGDRTKDKRAAIAAIDAEFKIGGLDAALHALRAVGRVAVDGLGPLVKSIETSTPARTP
jgi:hypothetical protein